MGRLNVQLGRQKVTLVSALSSMTVLGRRDSARRFLEGLSTDELHYIADYFGAQLLDPSLGISALDRNQLARQIELYQSGRGVDSSGCLSDEADVAHKMILLLEFLSMSDLQPETMAWSVAGGSA